MNTLEIEERVRAATRAAGETVTPDNVPPLRLPPDRPFRSGGGSRASMWARWLAPAAAAAAVIALAVTMVTVGQTVDHRAGGSLAVPSSSPARPGPVQAGPPISSYVASGRVPRYYFSLVNSSNSGRYGPSYAVVRATATGAALETYTPAAHNIILAATAAADDQTFVFDEQPWVHDSGQTNQNTEPRSFFVVRLDGSGTIAQLYPLPESVPAGQLMTGFALSPDGSRLAIAVQPDNDKAEPELTEVKVITLATGATATWTADGTVGTGPDDARAMSWASNERTLAFTWAAAGPGVHTGIWLLNVASGGGSLMADSREAVTLVNESSLGRIGSGPTLNCQLDAIVTPDGSAIVCGAVALVGRYAESGFIEYSTATGKVTRILGYWTLGTPDGLAVDLMWSNASGSVLIALIPDKGAFRVGVISGNEFTPLPGADGLFGIW
jgi:hypothetical protein